MLRDTQNIKLEGNNFFLVINLKERKLLSVEVHISVISALRRLKQEYLRFKANLDNTLS